MAELTPKPELQGASIVALGSFNPAIFQPRWLSMHGLIREEEADDADLQIVNREVSIFSTEWFSLQVTQENFTVDARDPTMMMPLRDLVVGIFNLLEHTPITAFGMNSYRHYRMESADEWHKFGHHFVPKQSWHDLLIEPGMRTLTVSGKREGCKADRVQIKLEPSVKVHPGIYISLNQHFQLVRNRTDDSQTEAEFDQSAQDRMVSFLRQLQESWPDFLRYCDSVAAHLFKEYKSSSE
jgi:hypothetical protein